MLGTKPGTIIVLALLAVCAGDMALAQDEKATLLGIVRDSQTGDPLPGASVQIKKTGFGASSDLEGRYIIRSMPPGSYTLRVVYIGYLEQEATVSVKGGETHRVDFRLTAVGLESEEVIVTAQAAGQKAAINQQLSALQIVNIVSRARIQELPDANAAESVSRLPGVSVIRTGGEGSQVVVRGLSPQYNQVTIDGVELPSNVTSANNIIGDPSQGGGLNATGNALGDRGEDLSMISSDMLGGITVTKAITPDMDAAVLGGVVDFDLRKAARNEHGSERDQSWIPLLEFKVQGGYTKLKNSYDNYRFQGSLERRFLDQAVGVFVQATAEKRNLSSNTLGADYILTDKNHGDVPMPVLNSISLADVFRKRGRLGGTAVLDFQHEKGEIALMNFISSSTTQEITRGEGMEPLSPASQLTYRADEADNQLKSLSNLLSVKQDLWIFQAHLKLSHSYGETLDPEDLSFRFRQRSPGFSNPADLINLSPKMLAASAIHDGANSVLQTIATSSQVSKERNVTASLDLATDVAVTADLALRVKAGGMFQHRTRSYDMQLFSLDGLDLGLAEAYASVLKSMFPWLLTYDAGLVSMLNFTRDSYQYGEFLKGDYRLAYPLNVSMMWDLMRPLKQQFLWIERYSLESFINDYSGYENKSAGYAMFVLNLGQSLSLIPGVRYQTLTTKYTAARGMSVPGGVQGSDTTVEHTHGFLLPMVHLRYKPVDWMQMHFAYTRTLSYPDYSTITPRYLIVPGVIDYNNHALKPSTSENLDLVVSFSSKSVGLLSLDGFKKKIRDLIFFSRTYTSDLSQYPDLPQGGTQLLTLNTYLNDPIPVNVYGIEAEWQTHLWYLPGPMDGLVLDINYTHIFSEASYPRSTVNVSYDDEGNMTRTVSKTFYTTRLLDQPNDIVNVALGYDLGGFSLRLSLLFRDNVFKRPDFWMQQRVNSSQSTRWDLSVKQELPWLGMQLFFNMDNITGEDDVDVNEKNGYPASEQRYGMSADVGVQMSF